MIEERFVIEELLSVSYCAISYQILDTWCHPDSFRIAGEVRFQEEDECRYNLWFSVPENWQTFGIMTWALGEALRGFFSRYRKRNAVITASCELKNIASYKLLKKYMMQVSSNGSYWAGGASHRAFFSLNCREFKQFVLPLS